jgi:hypothetical protein
VRPRDLLGIANEGIGYGEAERLHRLRPCEAGLDLTHRDDGPHHQREEQHGGPEADLVDARELRRREPAQQNKRGVGHDESERAASER